ncbi:ArsR family transcriptional regulator [Brachybacterium phenoliresistens]|uniref:ArsR family transcriptional regulator n=1 Tax=Brachybacterium phenoliresistens TaxID=396014 RepID=Z9JRG3_9MICO|nr:ArsR family transcriptional regulator [Brachybacterium phenoliresistens]
MDTLSRAFAALADPTRRDLVARLTLGDATVGELAAPYDMSLQAVSKHLKVLEEAGLVTRSRDAQRRPVHLETQALGELTRWIDQHRHRAEARMSRLESLLSRMSAPSAPDVPAPQGSPTPQSTPAAPVASAAPNTPAVSNTPEEPSS